MIEASSSQPLAPIRFLRLPAVMERTGLSRTTIYRLEMAGNFPRRVKLSTSGSISASAAWVESEIQAWAEARVAASRGDA